MLPDEFASRDSLNNAEVP